jgi:rhodanese-related sulfurtransferase
MNESLKNLVRRNYKNISAREFYERIKTTANAAILDVRTPSEFQSGNIAGALNMDVMAKDFATQVEGLDKSKTYFVYCKSGIRSATACNILTYYGF